mmetsp:Transcript_453/g.1018  ORF Transcript_453/g.1018 Transcript_453/m.1018 type:complete len:110 (-) Transcript_453:474-803(-)
MAPLPTHVVQFQLNLPPMSHQLIISLQQSSTGQKAQRKWYHAFRQQMRKVVEAVNIMTDTIESQLREGGEFDIWQLHHEHLNTVWENGGKVEVRKPRFIQGFWTGLLPF